MVGKDSLKGWILEEILAHLIRNTGYQLLVDDEQDPHGLQTIGNGLWVRGRGAIHQADVLGELLWIPAFTFPLRLFVESKCRAHKTRIGTVRNAVGLIVDINQKYSPIRDGKVLIPQFTYRYAIFSTSGFTKPASDMALAHQISLVDLSGPDFADLRDFLDKLANIFLRSLKQADSNIPQQNSRWLISSLRLHLRQLLNTWPPEIQPRPVKIKLPPLEDFDKLIRLQIDKFDEFFVGMANGPFLILFKPDTPKNFLRYTEQNPIHRVTIRWYKKEDRHQWVVQPVDNPDAYKLSFGLPQSFENWIFEDEEQASRLAWRFKKKFLSHITIYRHADEKDYLYRLIYDAKATSESVRRDRQKTS